LKHSNKYQRIDSFIYGLSLWVWQVCTQHFRMCLCPAAAERDTQKNWHRVCRLHLISKYHSTHFVLDVVNKYTDCVNFKWHITMCIVLILNDTLLCVTHLISSNTFLSNIYTTCVI